MRILAWLAGFAIGAILAATLIALAAFVMLATGSFVLGAITYFVGAIFVLWLLRLILRKLDAYEDWHRSYVDNSPPRR